MSIEMTTDQELDELQRNKMTTLDSFLRTGKSEVTHKGHPLVYDTQNAILWIKDGLVFQVEEWCHRSQKERVAVDGEKLREWYHGLVIRDFSHPDMMGTIVPSLVREAKFTLVMDGDENGGKVLHPKDARLATTLSYECLGQLLATPGRIGIRSEEVAKRIASSKLKVVAATADETLPVTAKVKTQIAALREKKMKWKDVQAEIKPPEAGMTLLRKNSTSSNWHRSATVLISDGTKTYLIGQDDDTYFGCELADNPKTISAAFTSLIPQRLRRKKGIFRQGEWFAIPIPTNKVPAAEKCVCTAQDAVILPKDHPNSNDHYVGSCDGEAVRVSPEGVFVISGILEHVEHPEVILPKDKWFTFIRNTAIRSVSQEGVD